MSRFQLPSADSSSSGGSDADDDDLPFPTELSRNDFLQPDFSPAQYLSSLENRHQTLEDLRGDLRSRSQLLSQELLDLVNANYQDFLGLGSSLRGGNDKVEEVKLGLLGFARDLNSVQSQVSDRKTQVDSLLKARISVRKDLVLVRCLLDYEARLHELEERLLIDSSAGTQGDGGAQDDLSEDDDGEEGSVTSRLQHHVQKYISVTRCGESIGLDHPFVEAQKSRVMRCRHTILLDISNALKQAQNSPRPVDSGLLDVLKLYRDMDEPLAAQQALRS